MPGLGAADGPQPAPDQPEQAVDAALAHVGSADCEVALFPFEDLAGLVEQPNLPGTTQEHPNWRRRMPQSTDTLLRQPEIARRLERLRAVRG